MNKLIRLSPTGIEYGDYAWNFASGCGNNIDGKCKAGGFKCWAYSICQRFEGHYPNGFKPAIYPEALLSPLYLKKPSRILCAFMGDLFWDCPEFDPSQGRGKYTGGDGYFTLKDRIFDTIEKCPQHTFFFLTKQPQNLIKWSPFPDHCRVGVTATDYETFYFGATKYLPKIQAKLKYISLEPFFGLGEHIKGWLTACLIDADIKWLIIGSQTKPYRPPAISHVREIVEAADKAGIPVFIKKNLAAFARNIALYPKMKVGDEGWDDVRQEMPLVR